MKNKVKKEAKEKEVLCDYCGFPAENPKPRPDPYAEEISGTIDEHILCDACYTESCQEI